MGFLAVSPKWELEPQDLTILHKVKYLPISQLQIMALKKCKFTNIFLRICDSLEQLDSITVCNYDYH